MFGWWQHLIASSCSAIISRFLTHPLDTLRVRIQSSQAHNTQAHKHDSGWQQFKQSLHGVTLANLYNGLAVALSFSAPAFVLYQGTYDGVKWLLVDALHLLTYDAFICHILGACAAEITSNLIWTPMELIKSRMQAVKDKNENTLTENIPFTLLVTDPEVMYDTWDNHEQPEHNSLGWRDACRLAYSIWKTNGMLGFLRGYWLGVFIYAPYSCIYFVIYERIKPAFGAALTNPLDVVRTRWQVSHTNDRAVSSANDWLSVAIHLWRYEGRWRAFTRGVWARVLAMVPGAVIGWTIFEMFRVYYTTPEVATIKIVSAAIALR
ncbi:mitochondrial carrier domain-containing protein [Syncephalis fuscata]|nr:mitochondrial carrier domain-containing protein [Syncephalis fuscata]